MRFEVSITGRPQEALEVAKLAEDVACYFPDARIAAAIVEEVSRHDPEPVRCGPGAAYCERCGEWYAAGDDHECLPRID